MPGILKWLFDILYDNPEQNQGPLTLQFQLTTSAGFI